ncbi:MAG: hypothetical protein QOI56_1667, partial [Actinomycetota bacterium]|nr:hypothetical protein [Actinomycetota bacterium]
MPVESAHRSVRYAESPALATWAHCGGRGVLFSRLGKPHIGSPNAYSFNIPTVKASGAITVERGPGKTKTEKATFNRLGGMCPRCEGMGAVTDFDLSALYDDRLSLNEGALTIPGYSMDGWYGRIYGGSGILDPDKP